MITRPALLVSLLLALCTVKAQSVSHVYKIDQLLKRISHPDTIYVVNFWATWCKPCVQELPAFDSLHIAKKSSNIKVLLVSLDFSDQVEKNVNPFLKKRNMLAECVLLDEVNGNTYINAISPQWSGAIPATLIKSHSNTAFFEKKLKLADLETAITQVSKEHKKH